MPEPQPLFSPGTTSKNPPIQKTEISPLFKDKATTLPVSQDWRSRCLSNGLLAEGDMLQAFRFYREGETLFLNGISGVMEFGRSIQSEYEKFSIKESDILSNIDFSAVKSDIASFVKWSKGPEKSYWGEFFGGLEKSDTKLKFQEGMSILNEISRTWQVVSSNVKTQLENLSELLDSGTKKLKNLEILCLSGKMLEEDSREDLLKKAVSSRLASLNTLYSAWDLDLKQARLIFESNTTLMGRFGDLVQIQLPLWRTQMASVISGKSTTEGINFSPASLQDIVKGL